MKIAISAEGKESSNNVAEFFGRCPYFIIAEVENGKIEKTEAIKNDNENQSGGAGMAAAKFLAENNVDVLIAKNVGPRAMDVLNQFKIAVHNEEGLISEALDGFIDKN